VYPEEEKQQLFVAKPRYLFLTGPELKAIDLRFLVVRPTEFVVSIRKSREGQIASYPSTKIIRKGSQSEASLIEFFRKRFDDHQSSKDPNCRQSSHKRQLTNFYVKRQLLYGKLNNVEAYEDRKEKVNEIMEKKQAHRTKLRQFFVNEAPVKSFLQEFRGAFGAKKAFEGKFKTSWAQILLIFGLVSRVKRGTKEHNERCQRASLQIRLIYFAMSSLRDKVNATVRHGQWGPANNVQERQSIKMLRVANLIQRQICLDERRGNAKKVITNFFDVLATIRRVDEALMIFSEQCELNRHCLAALRKAVHAALPDLPERSEPDRGDLPAGARRV